MDRKFETENVLFFTLIAVFLVITGVMGTILYGKKPHPPEKTLKVLIPATADNKKAQDAFTAEYKKLHPDMEIEPIMFPWRNIWQKLEFMIVANIPPDVSGIEQPQLPNFIHLGAVEPLDEWIRNDPGYDPSLYFPECMNEANWDNKQYGLPISWSTVCMWYNKKLFDEAGVPYPKRDWTRQDCVDIARKLTKDRDGNGYLDQWGMYTNNNHWHRYSAWIWMTGGGFFTKDLRRSTFGDPKVVDGFQWLADLALKYKVMPSTTDLAGMGSTNLFLAGDLAMLAETRYFLSNFGLERYQDKIKKFGWDVVELPRDQTRATVFVCGSEIIPKTVTPERKKMAWDYLKFKASETGQRIVADLNGPLPAMMTTAREKIHHPGEPPDNDIAFINSIEYARYPYRPFPAEEEWVEARSYLQGVWAGNLSVEEVCKRSEMQINAAMDRFFRLNPDAHLPEKTEWVPFDQRGHETQTAATKGQR